MRFQENTLYTKLYFVFIVFYNTSLDLVFHDCKNILNIKNWEISVNVKFYSLKVFKNLF